MPIFSGLSDERFAVLIARNLAIEDRVIAINNGKIAKLVVMLPHFHA